MKRYPLFLVVIILIALNLFGNHGLLRLIQLKQHANSLGAANTELMQANWQFAQEIERLKDPPYLERLIREERGYIRDGEMLLEIPSSP